MTTAVHTPSRACYQRGCRLAECERENYLYSKKLQLEHAQGEYRLHDVTQVRAHIERLIANNWWQAEIARVSGVPRSNIAKILTEVQQTSRKTALAILSIPVVPLLRNEQGDRVNATGSIRRLRALACLGHPYVDITAVNGMTQDRLTFIAAGNTDLVRPEEARKIAAAYRALSTKPGRMKQIATAARNKGWHGPLAWDEIDDPNCQPENEGQTSAHRRRKVVVDIDLVARRTKQGRSADEIAREIGCHKRSVVRARSRVAEIEQAAKAGLEAAA